MKNQTIFELYTDDNKSKYPSNPKDILKSGIYKFCFIMNIRQFISFLVFCFPLLPEIVVSFIKNNIFHFISLQQNFIDTFQIN